MPAAAFARLTRPRHHRAERHQVAGGMIERLRRQFLRTVDPGHLSFGMVETGCGLHQRVEAATLRPWPCTAIGRQRNIDDARTDPCGVLGGESEPCERMRTVALRKN